MDENAIAREVVDASFRVHTGLGAGLLESVYEVVLARELSQRGLVVERQKPISIRWGDATFEEGFRADLVVEDLVLVEVKSIERVAPVHAKQVLTYLRLTGIKLGLLINFGDALIKNGINPHRQWPLNLSFASLRLCVSPSAHADRGFTQRRQDAKNEDSFSPPLA